VTESTASAPPAATKTSVWEDFIDIFYAPSQVFARRENNGFGLALVVLTVVMTVLFYATRPLLQPLFDAEMARQMEAAMRANPQLTAEQFQTGRRFFDAFGGLFVLFGVPVTVLLIGLVMWIAGKLFDSRQTLRSAFVVATYAYFPRIVEQIANAIQGFLLDPARMTSQHSVKLGVSRFMGDGDPLLLALLGRVDLFTIWITVLIAIGLSVTGKIPLARAAIVAAIVWLVGAVPSVMGALGAR
jgi:hypothetical protein